MQALSQDQILARLTDLNVEPAVHWILEDGKLSKTFTFKNFIEAFGFMTRVALHAEKVNHHPEWFNVYKTVKVKLVTHEAGGITVKDFELAAYMDSAL